MAKEWSETASMLKKYLIELKKIFIKREILRIIKGVEHVRSRFCRRCGKRVTSTGG